MDWQVSGPTSEGSQTAAQCDGSTATEDRFQAILALQLANPNNYCYMNATVLAVLWMACCWSGDFQSLGAKAGTFLTILRSARNCALTGLLPWKLLIQQWRHGNRQHDAFEFLQFLLPGLDAPLFRGEWEARRLPEGTTDRDPTGYLCLDMSGTDQCLQHYVDGWRHQFSEHAFTILAYDFQTLRQGQWAKCQKPGGHRFARRYILCSHICTWSAAIPAVYRTCINMPLRRNSGFRPLSNLPLRGESGTCELEHN